MYNFLLSILFYLMSTTSPTMIYTLSLHDALPISLLPHARFRTRGRGGPTRDLAACLEGIRTVRGALQSAHLAAPHRHDRVPRSEEHTSELQSRGHLVCRLLLEKKKNHKR